MRQLSRTGLVLYLAMWIVMIGALPQDVNAAIAPSDVGSQLSQRASDVQYIQTQLESKMIAQRLNELGLTTGEVEQRLHSLSDEQIHQVAQNLEGLQPGGALVLILAIIGAVVVILAIIGLARQA